MPYIQKLDKIVIKMRILSYFKDWLIIKFTSTACFASISSNTLCESSLASRIVKFLISWLTSGEKQLLQVGQASIFDVLRSIKHL